MSCVYGLCSGDGVKIGVTADLGRRLMTLQIGNPAHLSLMFTIPCPDIAIAFVLERMLHKWLADERVRGEWFIGPKAFWLAGFLHSGMGLDEARQVAGDAKRARGG